MSQRYEIEEMVSQDAQGVAFRARDREQQRDVVLRRFFPNGRDGGGLQPTEQQAFLDAVEKLKALKLKELRKTFDGGCDPVDGMPFLVTDWVEGDTLATFTRGKALEPASVKDIVEVALRASQVLSGVLGHEALWVGCREDSLIIPESGRGITFWVEPLATLNTRGLLPVAELAERLLGLHGKPAQPDSAGDGMAGWIRQIRASPKAWSLAQALDALQKPATAVTSTVQIQRPGTPTKPGAVPTKQGAHPAKLAKKRKTVWPWVTASLILVLGGGGFAAWKSGALDQVIAKAQGPAAKRPATAEEMRKELAAKTMPPPAPVTPAGWNASGPPPSKLPTTPPAAPAAKPAEPPKPVAKSTAPAASANSLSGKVVAARQSSSGKTRYLELLVGGATRWVGYEAKQNRPGLEMTDLQGFVGKTVTVTGEFKKEQSHRGDVLQIGKREDIKVQP